MENALLGSTESVGQSTSELGLKGQSSSEKKSSRRASSSSSSNSKRGRFRNYKANISVLSEHSKKKKKSKRSKRSKKVRSIESDSASSCEKKPKERDSTYGKRSGNEHSGSSKSKKSFIFIKLTECNTSVSSSSSSGVSKFESLIGGKTSKKIKRSQKTTSSDVESEIIEKCKKKKLEKTESDDKQKSEADLESIVDDVAVDDAELLNPPKRDFTSLFGEADDVFVAADDAHSSVSQSKLHIHSKASNSVKQPKRDFKSLFGEADDVFGAVDDTVENISPSETQIHSPADSQRELEEPCLECDMPANVLDLGNEFHLVKLPNFLSIETRPFDAATYEDEIDEEEIIDEEGRQRIKLKVSNTIRWREVKNDDGEIVRESNTRIVRWSDGSMTMHLGSEIFDVFIQPLQGEHSHLYTRHDSIFQAKALFSNKLVLRPYSIESFTHKKMTMSIADRYQKTSAVKMLTQVGKDPLTDRKNKIKLEEQKLRQAMRGPNKSQPKKKSNAVRLFCHDGDDNEDENGISLSAIKNKYKRSISASGSDITSSKKSDDAKYSSSESEESEIEMRRPRKVVTALIDSDSES